MLENDIWIEHKCAHTRVNYSEMEFYFFVSEFYDHFPTINYLLGSEAPARIYIITILWHCLRFTLLLFKNICQWHLHRWNSFECKHFSSSSCSVPYIHCIQSCDTASARRCNNKFHYSNKLVNIYAITWAKALLNSVIR